MRQSGQIDELYKKHVSEILRLKPACKKKTSSNCIQNDPTCVPAISLKTIWTALLILLFGVLCAAIMVLLEWLDAHGHLENLKCTNTRNLGKNALLCIYAVIFMCAIIALLSLLAYFIQGKSSYGDLDILEADY